MLQLYNTLTRKKEVFKPIKKGVVGMYSCGPTVYNYAHNGNFRTYIFNDFLARSLRYLGYSVQHVMNITDVDDKTIKGSQAHTLSLKEFTCKYEQHFLQDSTKLNIQEPLLVRATDSIDQMIALIQRLLKKGYAYAADDGIYFSIATIKGYGALAQLKKTKKTKARIAADSYNKDDMQDFDLWKFHTPADGAVYWSASFGKGRPGWHIECSAMSMHALGEHIDIHTGAADLIFPHHTNEIAQSEAASGKKFVNYWLHGGFLTMKEGKMSKSVGNVLTLKELIGAGYAPLDFRYLCLQTHYRKPLAFAFDTLDAAKNAYGRLKRKVIELRKETHKGTDMTKEYESGFKAAIEDDLNIPKALQVFWQALDDFSFQPKKKLSLLEKFDSVLGLGIKDMREGKITTSGEVRELIAAREQARAEKQWVEADILRERIKEAGYIVEDTPQGPNVTKA